MKKTTTRLATTTAVLLMSAFAIILAQHDARKSAHQHGRDSQSPAAPSEPPMPLAVDGWPSSSAVVRGNNEAADQSTATSADSFDNPLRDLPTATFTGLEQSLSSGELPGSEVITASGESPAQPALLPDLPSGTAGPAALQPMPGSLPANFPSFDNLPSGSFAQPITQPSIRTASGQLGQGVPASLPSSTSVQHAAAPQNPSMPQNLAGAPNRGQPNPASGGFPPPGNWPPTGSSASMSDTQRGAMVPTQLVDGALNSQPPAMPSPSSSFPSTTVAPADRDLSGSGFAPLNAPPASSGAGFSANPAASLASPAPATGFGQPASSNTGSFANNVASGGMASSGSMNNGSDGFSVPGRSVSGSVGNAIHAGDAGSFAGPRATLASNQPGSRFLDGSQNPVMQIHKRAPEEITVGKKATFVITVRNAGNATAHDVTVVDRIPRGARFADASPSVSPSADGLLTWKLGEMNAGDEKTISLQIIPEAEGEVGSVASVHFAAQASVRTMATAPQLEVTADAAGPVIIGQAQQIAVTIRNSGSGVSRGVRLEADIPSQLKHESGEAQLEAFIGDLRPNESKRLMLNVAAVQPGQSSCPLRAVNEDGVQAQTQFSVDVRAPQLAATISGPARRYLERQATYQIVVNNTGTAVARNLYFDVHLPVGLKFVSADIAQATYHPDSHSVTLGLAELNPGASGAFTVSVLPVELGPQSIRFNATGDLGITAEAKGQMVVEGLSELTFAITQDNGTVEVGATTTYSVQVSNVGNQSDKNVQLLVQIPEGAKLLKVDAPVEFREEPGRLVFAPIAEMRSRDAKTLRFQIQHNRAGNQVIRAQLTSANWPVAVLKEEGTLVYNDQ